MEIDKLLMGKFKRILVVSLEHGRGTFKEVKDGF